ncbi:hypothetical protein CEUSTIGMA_g11823.t1 [Chlamydomonas eustigma]|uniref:Matrin-type domain-containing protein n=1 Tax=Chlamydomonas eustigma TaxID=1157962 RepID=A0A250XMT0_9CHLO|nr:hypothetical protein CEUSTIGMA_g11823.t1 [Chlamydomonas eustigma]|eukprot:GAX84401.1 hypothetical protein CEUSTIGMA_g11823.t1 [Chlamydomonas eustigma]
MYIVLRYPGITLKKTQIYFLNAVKMTEYWKSNKMHWCDVCKCWMNDNKQAIQNHERGMGHTENLKRKLREMTLKASQEKRTKEHVENSISKIQDKAMKQYEEDLRAAEAQTGRWKWDESSQYYYNTQYGWYYDLKTQWYYGGDPPSWSQSPTTLPETARFEAAPHEGGPSASRLVGRGLSNSAGPSSSYSTAPPSSSAPGSTRTILKPSTDGTTMVSKTVVMALPQHPQAATGGHNGPTIGRVGAAKGLTDISSGGAGVKVLAAEAAKRKREADAASGKAVSAQEAEAMARREAARLRVAQRTAQGFGYL